MAIFDGRECRPANTSPNRCADRIASVRRSLGGASNAGWRRYMRRSDTNYSRRRPSCKRSKIVTMMIFRCPLRTLPSPSPQKRKCDPLPTPACKSRKIGICNKGNGGALPEHDTTSRIRQYASRAPPRRCTRFRPSAPCHARCVPVVVPNASSWPEKRLQEERKAGRLLRRSHGTRRLTKPKTSGNFLDR